MTEPGNTASSPGTGDHEAWAGVNGRRMAAFEMSENMVPSRDSYRRSTPLS